MIPASFDYSSPKTLSEAISLLAKHGSDAKILAGGIDIPITPPKVWKLLMEKGVAE
jgi:CO/xanthine dehydrogenase FAD-binding subunit